MSAEIIIALIGVASTVVSWLLGRRRTNAEIANMQMDYIKKADVFYNGRIDTLQEEVTKQAKQIRILKLVIDKMLDDACLSKNCSKRIYYTPATLKEIMDTEELGINIPVTKTEEKH